MQRLLNPKQGRSVCRLDDRVFAGWIFIATLWLGQSPPLAVRPAHADWPQFMGDAAHRGLARTEVDPAVLGLQHQVVLGEAILTSPAIRGGRAYVVDQMGTAYCVDLATGDRVWLSELDRAAGLAIGGNTSSPALLDDRLVYGTTDGRLRFLDLDSGRVLVTETLGWPVTSSVTVANDRIYVPTVDSSLHCFSATGEHLWSWDHYRLSERWRSDGRSDDDADRFERPHFGGAPVAVWGDRVFAPFGYDLVCLEDLGDRAVERWRRDRPVTVFDIPLGASTDGESVFCVWPKSDGQGAVIRHRAADGEPLVTATGQWAVMHPPAIDAGQAVFNRHAFGTLELDFADARADVRADTPARTGDRVLPRWQGFGITADSVAPSMSATAITENYAVTTTMDGQVLAFPRRDGDRPRGARREPAYRFTLPGGVMTTSSPAMDEGRIVFGADDGCLYVIGPGGQAAAEPRPRPRRTLSQSDPGRQWPGAFGDGDNTSLVRDPDFRPPFGLRWAMASFGLFKHPMCADRGDLISSSFSGIVVCRDQASGKIHWRRKLYGQAWSRATPLVADGKVFIPRVSSPRYAMIVDQPDVLVCLDQTDGRLLWERPIGRGDWLRASPLFADGVVAYGSKYETPRDATILVGAGNAWRVSREDPPADWFRPTWDDGQWDVSRIANDGDVPAWRGEPTSAAHTLYLRTTFRIPVLPRSTPATDAAQRVGLVIGPHDECIAFVDGKRVSETPGWASGDFPEAAKYVGVAARVVPIDVGPQPGRLHLAIAIRRAGVKSNVSASTSVFPPRLIAYRHPSESAGPGTIAKSETAAAGRTGPMIEAWDASTGEFRWAYSLPAAGDYIEGPAGGTDGETFYFTGGGAGRRGRGQTLALRPADGHRLWSTAEAYACRTGTPAISRGRLILPGAIGQPLAALDRATGRLLWRNDAVTELTLVHSPSILGDLMTVNTKYAGGAKCWDVTSGEPISVATDGDRSLLDLSGGGHTCSPIVMTAAGYAITATNKGIYATDLSTGKVVGKTPGFASQTCPHPIVADGRMFYSPQNNGMLYCFEPLAR